MPILRLSNGRAYANVDAINSIVAPLQVGRFDLPERVREVVAGFKQPLSKTDAMFVLKALDPNAAQTAARAGFIHRRVGNVVPSPEDGSFLFVQRDEESPADAPPRMRSPQEIQEYLVPHYVQVNDWHFVFSGAIVKGLRIDEGLQGVVYCQAGEWVRLGPRVLNWPIFPYGEATVAVSYFDRPFSSGPFPMELHPEVKVLPGMTH